MLLMQDTVLECVSHSAPARQISILQVPSAADSSAHVTCRGTGNPSYFLPD